MAVGQVLHPSWDQPDGHFCFFLPETSEMARFFSGAAGFLPGASSAAAEAAKGDAFETGGHGILGLYNDFDVFGVHT